MSRLIGNKKFYRTVLAVAVPIMIQNGITNFVSLLDNIMVGRVGTEQMSGVAISNQLMFVFNLCIFGAVSGASIFSSQFYGKRDFDGMRYAFRFKMIICILLSIIGIVIFLELGNELINLYLTSSTDTGNATLTFGFGRDYLIVMLFGMVPFAVSQVYSSTLREMGETLVPMIAGIAAVIINLILNYILIFGKLGIPELGVVGAAIATVISRYVESLIVMLWTHLHNKRYPFIIKAYRSLYIPGRLVKRILLQGSPLMINEGLWSAGMAILMQCYSLRGLEVIAAMNISSTISNLFNVVFISLGSAVSIIIGPMLGANEMDKAKDAAGKLIAFSVFVCFIVGGVMALTSPLFPLIYNTTDDVRRLAGQLILVAACCMPIYAFMHAEYFTLRSGGKTIITFLFDSGFLWAAIIPCAYIMSRFTDISIIPLYTICQLMELIKCAIGFVLVKKGVWLNNIT